VKETACGFISKSRTLGREKSSSFFGTPSFGRLPFPASRKFYLGLAARYDARLRTQFLYKCKALQRERAAEVSQTEEK
jgi:hypothetical protein